MQSVLAFVLLVAATAVLAPSLDARDTAPDCPSFGRSMLESIEHAAFRHFERLQCLRGLAR